MGTEHLYDASGLPRDTRPVTGTGASAPGGADRSVPTPTGESPPGASLPPGPQDELAALTFAWGDAYAIAACATGLTQTWTAVRLDTAAVFTAGTCAALTSLIRADYTRCPVPRHQVARDYLLERLRAKYRGWAIVLADQGVLAVRGTMAVGPLPQRAMDCTLAEITVREGRPVPYT